MENLQDRILMSLLGFLEAAQPKLSTLEPEKVSVVKNLEMPYPYLTFKDSNVILCPFKPLKSR